MPNFKAETFFLFFLALLGLDRKWQSKLMEVLFCSDNLSDGLYLVNHTVLEILNSEIVDKSLKSKRHLPKSISKLWLVIII